MPSLSKDPANAYSQSGWHKPGETGRRPADLLVLGGGILGLSTACEALARGLSVTLFDEAPATSATLAAAGMLSPWAELIESDFLQEWMRQGRAAYPAYVARVEELSGCKIELSFPGTLLVSPDADAGEKLQRTTDHFVEMGASARYLTSVEASEDEPLLGARTSGAILLDEEGYVTTHTLHRALRMGFERLGGEWIPLHALGLVVRKGQIAGVETAAGVVLGAAVLNAAGAMADRFLLPEDQERYRTRAVRGQALRLRPASAREGLRRVVQAPGFGYLVPQPDASVIVGATSEFIGPYPGVTAGGLLSVLEHARILVPAVAEWSFVEAWSGLRPLAGDGEPILAPDTRKGLFHGLGLYRHGILLAPVATSRLLKMILDHLGRIGS